MSDKRKQAAGLVTPPPPSHIQTLTITRFGPLHSKSPLEGALKITISPCPALFFSNPPWGDSYIIQLSWRFVRGVSSIEAPGTGSMAWVAKGNQIIFEFFCLCPSAVSCLRGRLVHPTAR